jgi:hypothetical protein
MASSTKRIFLKRDVAVVVGVESGIKSPGDFVPYEVAFGWWCDAIGDKPGETSASGSRTIIFSRFPEAESER